MKFRFSPWSIPSVLSLCIYLVLPSASFSQDIEWQQVLGGAHSEYLYDVKATPDYGFLLAGSSFSEDSGNKTEKGQGDLDYFLWKMDESGKMEWQKAFGGSGSDYLYSVGLTSDGGFILGGSSDSPVSGDKLDACLGNMDFWIIKINPEGEEEWQLTLGGIGNDQLQSIQQTPDGGYIIGGSSDSSLPPAPSQGGENSSPLGRSGGAKSEDSRGSFDYWIVKLSALGEIEWEKTYGGMFSDQLKSILILEDGYLVGGTSNSPPAPKGGDDKTAEHFGMGDFWIIRLNGKGEQVWQRSYGGEGDESLANILQTEKGFLLAGSSASPNPSKGGGKTVANGNGTDFWVIEITESGEPLWDNSYDFGKWDVLVSGLPSLPLAPSKGGGTDGDGQKGGYLLGGYASTETLGKRADNKGINDYIVLKINHRGEMLWSKTIGGKDTDQLKGLVQTRDGGYILAGNSDSKKSDDKDKASIGGNDYWIVKLGEKGKQEQERQLVEVYPNPTHQFTNIVISESFTQAKVEVFDMTGRKLQSRELPYRSTAVDLQGYPPGVYIFKITVDGKTEDVKAIKKGSK